MDVLSKAVVNAAETNGSVDAVDALEEKCENQKVERPQGSEA